MESVISASYFAPKVFDQVPEILGRLKAKGAVSIDQIARALDVNEKTVRKWLSGVTEPRLSDFGRMAKLCGIETIADLSEFLEGRRADSPEEERALLVAHIEELIDQLSEVQRGYTRAKAELKRLRGDNPNH